MPKEETTLPVTISTTTTTTVDTTIRPTEKQQHQQSGDRKQIIIERKDNTSERVLVKPTNGSERPKDSAGK
jgi:hypothetical protein